MHRIVIDIMFLLVKNFAYVQRHMISITILCIYDILYTATEVQYICGDAMAPILFVCGLTLPCFALPSDENSSCQIALHKDMRIRQARAGDLGPPAVADSSASLFA